MEKVEIGDATLYLGDCLDILPALPKACLVIADPPYGVGESHKRNATRGGPVGGKGSGKKTVAPIDYGEYEWDGEPASQAHIAATIEAGKYCIVWGGNYFHLPPATGWLVWDKINTGDFADCELAWSNLPIAVRQCRHMWNGMLRDSERNTPRVHPTQKPIALMKWCIQKMKEPPKLVVDPFMGSAPVGLACVDMGIKYIGIEKIPRNFDIAYSRIEEAQKQLRLF
jgi:site-specific DNA-methyltransferase (adenine-specific)/modification methylase